MILITKNTTNIGVLTLSEKTTIASAVYLFEFINDETLNKKYFLSADISLNKERINRFEIIDNASELPLVGQMDFELGFHKYNVYEQSSTTNLDPLLAYALIDNGKANVIVAESTPSTFSATQENYVVYGG